VSTTSQAETPGGGRESVRDGERDRVRDQGKMTVREGGRQRVRDQERE
jgi:hypothetical protein